MDAAPMVNRCLELQTDRVQAPFIPSGHLERIPDGFNTDCASEWCDRCGCNHGSGTTHGTVYEYGTDAAPG